MSEQSEHEIRDAAPVLPNKILLEAGEIYGSEQSGITKGMFRKAVDAGAITPVSIPGRKRRHKYRRDEVIRIFRLEEKGRG
jgi:translation initiation factor IF-1